MARFQIQVTAPGTNSAPFPGGVINCVYDTSAHAQTMVQQLSTLLQVPLSLFQIDTSPQFVLAVTPAAQGSALGSQVATISY